MNREFIERLLSQNVKIFTVSRAAQTYYINLNHPHINWDDYSNFYLYSSGVECNRMSPNYDYRYNLDGLEGVYSFKDIVNYNESTWTSKKINKPKINKSKVVKEIKEDKFGTNLVLELRTQEIYLSNALLSYLNLKDGSKVNFASDDETNQNYLYIETEENEGYEIKDNIIVCPHNVILFKTLFGTDVLYLDIREENLAEEPSYVFYPISEENPQEIQRKSNYNSYNEFMKKAGAYMYKSLGGNGTSNLSNTTITSNISSPVVEKVSEPLDLMEEDEE
jgi:hypothetical protein